MQYANATPATSKQASKQALGSTCQKVPVLGKKLSTVTLAALLLLGGHSNLATAAEGDTPDKTADTSDAQKTNEQGNDAKSFAGIKFGTGISASFRHQPIVTNAEVVGGVVRVTEETSAVARVLLETHYLFTCEDDPKGKFCGPGIRIDNGPADRNYDIGFRLARTLP